MKMYSAKLTKAICMVAGVFSFVGCGGFVSRLDGDPSVYSEEYKARLGLPTVPTSLQAVVISSSEIELSWDPASITKGQGSISFYHVYRNGIEIATVAAPQNSYRDTGLAAGTVYSYQVSAQSSSGKTSSLSLALSVSTLSSTAVPTPAPTSTPPPAATATPAPPVSGESLLSSQVPSRLSNTDSVDYELGMKFYSVSNGAIKAIKFFKSSSESGTHIGKIYSSTGTLLASVTFSNESASGWQSQALSSPLSIAANTTYVVSVNTSNTYYVMTVNGLSSQVSSANLRSVVGTNGVYGAVGSMPASSWENSNYFRDVVFESNGEVSPTPAPTPAPTPTPTPTPIPEPMPSGGLSFRADEPFGVSHPDQILSFMPSTAINPTVNIVTFNGSEVPYQILSTGELLVRARGGVQASSQNEWRLQSGVPTNYANDVANVKVRDAGANLEIDNGLIAVRVTKPVAGLSPVVSGDGSASNGPFVPAPIQGVRYEDGTWTATGPNPLKAYDNNNGLINFPATSMQTRVVESGPLRVVVEVNYVGYRPVYSYGNHFVPGGYDGYYKCRITLEAGQNSIIVEDRTDFNLVYSYDLNRGVNADLARYRGAAASDIRYGREPNGSIYRWSNERPDMDAELNLDYSQPIGVSDGSSFTASPTSRPPVYSWYGWYQDSGYYWQIFNSASPGNMFGLFQGPASKVDGCQAPCAVGIFNRTNSSGVREAGISAFYFYRAATDAFSTAKTYSYGIFVGKKSRDVVDATLPQAIGRAMNIYSGISFNKTIKYQLEFPEPAGGWQGLHLSYEQMVKKIQTLRADAQGPYGTGLYAQLYAKDAYYRDVWDAFGDGTNAKASTLAAGIVSSTRNLLDVYINKGSIYTHQQFYWMGGLSMQGLAERVNALLVLDRYSPFLTTDQRKTLKSSLSLFANILWDNDFVPLDNYQSFNLGTANMPIQQQGFRQLFAIALKDHPAFSTRYLQAVATAENSLNTSTNAYGASMSSPHYTGPWSIPTTDTMKQLQLQGLKDEFSSNGRLKQFAEFVMQLTTPPEPRFGNRRKNFASGDGPTEGSTLPLAMIMGFASTDPTLSKRLMGLWKQHDMPYDSFYGSSGLKIDESMPYQDPALGDGNFPGYMNVMRSGWGTPNESAIFHITGGFYTDHAGCDVGASSIYLLGAPVSVLWGSMYAPQIHGPWGRNFFLPEAGLPGAWTNLTSMLTGASGFCGLPGMAVQGQNFTASSARADSSVSFANGWTRKMTLYRDQAAQPILRIRDANANSVSSILSLNMMAQGAVITPSGAQVTPALAQLGSLDATVGPLFNLPAGQPSIRFTGQWGVSWDVFVIDSPGSQAYVGHYGHTSATAGGATEFQAVTGASFSEQQYILRMKSGVTSDVIIVPYRTGQRPSDLSVTRMSGAIQIRANGTLRTLGD